MKYLIMIFLAITIQSAYASAQSISCTMFASTSVFGDVRKFKTSSPKGFGFELHHISTSKPFLKANMGVTDLMKVMESTEAIWLMELVPFGSVNIYTYFKKERKVVFSKQYRFLGKPFGNMLYGNCKTLN